MSGRRFCIYICYNRRKKNSMLTINKVLRILSYVSVVSPIPFAFAEKSGTGFLGVCESFWIGACAVLLSAPLSAEVLSEGWRSIIAPFVCYITVLLCSSFACSPLIPRFLILSILVLLIFSLRITFNNIISPACPARSSL